MREALPPPRVRVALRQTPCRTLLSYAGPYQLTLASTLCDLGVELHSCYLGQRQAGYIATSHLAVVTGRPSRVFCAPNDTPGAPVGERRRDCLTHHLEQLRVLVAEATGAGAAVIIDAGGGALARMDHTDGAQRHGADPS